MITFPLKPILILLALAALLWAGGTALLQLVMALLAINEVRIAVFAFIAGLACAYTLGWNGAVRSVEQADIEKAHDQAQARRRRGLL
jgi:membrane protein implicated in regulation of membrane protease activity